MKHCIGAEFSLLQSTVNQIAIAVFTVALGLFVAVANAEPPNHLVQARDFAKKGNPHQAMVSYHRALRETPGDTEVLMGLADSYYRLGQRDKALTYAKQVPALDQANRHRALLLMGRIESRNQNWLQAKYYYKQALAQRKTDSALLGLAQALSRLGDAKGSETAYADYRQLQGQEK